MDSERRQTDLKRDLVQSKGSIKGSAPYRGQYCGFGVGGSNADEEILFYSLVKMEVQKELTVVHNLRLSIYDWLWFEGSFSEDPFRTSHIS